MDFRFLPPDLRRLDDASAELIACGIWSDRRPMRGLAGLLDWRLAGRLSRLLRSTYFEGAIDDVLFVPGRPRLNFEKVLVFGMGPREAFDEAAYTRVARRVLDSLAGLNVRRAIVELPGRGEDAIEPERAAEIVLEAAFDAVEHDAWWLVEDVEGQRRITQRTQEERRRSRRA